MSVQPRIAVTLGDPRGIGAEVTVRALHEPARLEAEVTLVGPEGVGAEGGGDLGDPNFLSVGRWSQGQGPKEAGHLSFLAIDRAVTLAMEGRVDAIVTAPISKSALAAAGYTWPGHTEMLRDLTGTRETALCMAAETTPLGGALRVVLVTGHMALRQVPSAYTQARLESVAQLAHAGLRRWWGLERPRMMVCAFNPHASDDGLFGDEEERVCKPAIARLRAKGLDVEGPYPADTVFLSAARGAADAVLAPYHDVGMTAIKTASFGTATNVTLGLPFPRTSPDHGTALDIAGTGKADPRSMRLALEAAQRFALRALTSNSDSTRLADG